MKRLIPGYYWRFQLGGWGLFLLLLNLPNGIVLEKLLIYILPGLLTTHLLRNCILRYDWLKLPLKKGLLRLSAGVLLASLLAALMSESVNIFAASSRISQRPLLLSAGSIYLHSINYIIPILSWTIIYVLHYYALKTHKTVSLRRQLELRLEEKKLHAQESPVNIDFLIDSLNHIQTSIDENPARSRAEITKFSSLLRKGYLNPE